MHEGPCSDDHFVTEPGEREQCCAVIGGERCERRTAFRIAAEDGALDDYTYTCADHVELAAGPGYVVTPVEHLHRAIFGDDGRDEAVRDQRSACRVRAEPPAVVRTR